MIQMINTLDLYFATSATNKYAKRRRVLYMHDIITPAERIRTIMTVVQWILLLSPLQLLLMRSASQSVQPAVHAGHALKI